ncbi:MAG: ribbon-helix-helix domain-containing protein [Alphaproteobacteria bacterium]|nr:ribbon-helix-helix domain-containing protein [Alphaproteobacteria bacterium]
MNPKMRSIEVDAKTAKRLDAMAGELGVSVSELVAELAGESTALPKSLDKLRKAGRGPWSPSVLAEDARRTEAFERTGKGVPWNEVRDWLHSWGSADERAIPKPRKL